MDIIALKLLFFPRTFIFLYFFLSSFFQCHLFYTCVLLVFNGTFSLINFLNNNNNNNIIIIIIVVVVVVVVVVTTTITSSNSSSIN
jgi:uncharacterized membrane protein YhhN